MEHEEGVEGGGRFRIFFCQLSVSRIVDSAGLKLTSFTGPGVIL